MTEADALQLIHETHSLVFSTREFAALANIQIVFASQMLRRLAAKSRLTRIYQGLWADAKSPEFNTFLIVPFITRPHPAAISLFIALHLHGMIEQVPQVIDVVSTAMTRKIKTPLGSFSVHKISPDFFQGYENGYGSLAGHTHFLVATPEKALVDCLYFSVRKGNRFGSFPELTFPKTFSRQKVFQWVKKIPYDKIRIAVTRRAHELLAHEK